MGMGVGQGTLTMRGKRGLGDDGSEVIKRHSWFKGVDWESKFTPYFHILHFRLACTDSLGDKYRGVILPV